jgi:hypothetical protein
MTIAIMTKNTEIKVDLMRKGARESRLSPTIVPKTYAALRRLRPRLLNTSVAEPHSFEAATKPDPAV